MKTPPHPDRVLRPLSDVPAYLKLRYGVTVTRQTVYNWMNVGRQNIRLRTATKSPVDTKPHTTWEWVRDFLAKTK